MTLPSDYIFDAAILFWVSVPVLSVQMTDTDPAVVKVGLEVELVMRRLHGAGGYYNYYWKCRPLKQGGAK